MKRILRLIYFLLVALVMINLFSCSNSQQTVTQVCNITTGVCNTVNTYCENFNYTPQVCEIAFQVCNYAGMICMTVTEDNAAEVYSELKKVNEILTNYSNSDNAAEVEQVLTQALDEYKTIYASIE